MKKGFFFVFLILLAGFGIYFYPKVRLYLKGFDRVELEKNKNFHVSTGADFNDVFKALNDSGIITDKYFKTYANARNLNDRTVRAGKYSFNSGESWKKVVEKLRLGNGEEEVKITFNNTRTLREITDKIAQNIELSSDELLKYLSVAEVQQKYGFNEHTIRALFIPNTYQVYWDISLDDLIARLAKEYKSFWTAERKSKAKSIGLSQSQVSTLASIVYTETAKTDEAPKIAGVYMNRLKLGMPLQADPTLIFAIGDFSIKRVLNKDKEIESPYNTYKYTGLPPGPIYVAPISYIDAVLNYEKHDYLYFCAKPDFSGYANFSKTLSQHNIYARQYQQALNKRKTFR